ncbi:methyltransferase domain-containing protein [Oceanobacter kriegii]|uniref:methyltransferase domain-containing protein n=1 Tax=Oceanobacter kriegii TaxID=64972 RepID=UPI0004265698|nr:methyltransferase domain-containing protein [Oceanobacter kriegii]
MADTQLQTATTPLRDKQQVGRQFSRAASSYDGAASIQQQALDQLMLRLAPHIEQPAPQALWLDIGCGTGNAFEPLTKLGVNQLHGFDLADGMLEVAHRKADHLRQQHLQSQPNLQQNAALNIELTQADADHLPLADQQAAGMISSLMLQWSEHTERTLREWHRVAKPGALLAVATLLPGTHAEIHQTWQHIDSYRHVNRFDSESDIKQALAESQWQLLEWHTELLQEHHNSVPELLRCLKAIGATNVNSGRRPGLNGRQILRLFEQHYPRTSEGPLQGQCPLSYQVCWFIARKPDSSVQETETP